MRNGDDGRAAKAPPPPPDDGLDENSSKLAAELFESSDFPETQSRPVTLQDSGMLRPSSGFGGDERTRVFEAPPGNLAELLAKDDEKPYEHVFNGATSVMQLDPEMLKMLQGDREEAAKRAAQEDIDSSAIAASAASAMDLEHATTRRSPLQEISDEPSTPRSQTPFTDDAFGNPDGSAGFDNEPTGQISLQQTGSSDASVPRSSSPSFSLPDI
ncbi:MAG: hypothetical protein H7Z43_07095, partial [Clostridia bacterium]|nr:hypothetical protein [Deltaproteobacteria bacterium]